ncbi:DASH complex, subunit Spc34 [Pseudovirgaria hyperparasitica]|uniref:DASH complex subunit SPC34 n=1 Tax=Pseudovirgaria hyperparasitica TaxID=470096 RepID=A0A6A6WE76_9PEZI|nr:DASH complex, subunit Spc34 [Pseudovirgaria hyperparasitica]KAF2760176.1 DASH complex, subunit Spc34 [Pseudovirgaria hyperparasitica]
MTALDNHLQQISSCAAGISDIAFPPPKIFTNALLQTHDITTLIRDTELHERALFSVPPPPPTPKAQDPSISSNRRNTVFNINGATTVTGGGANAVRAPRRNTAVAAVLGTELVEKIRRGGGGGVGTGMGYRTFDARDKHDIDVNVLLEGAERLCSVYPIAGAQEKIAALRKRHLELIVSIEDYEIKVAEQNERLNRMNRRRDFDDDDEADQHPEAEPESIQAPLTDEDYHREEEAIKELEQKKLGLEERVTSMGKDITGVLR